jgi:hypothetical protein
MRPTAGAGRGARTGASYSRPNFAARSIVSAIAAASACRPGSRSRSSCRPRPTGAVVSVAENAGQLQLGVAEPPSIGKIAVEGVHQAEQELPPIRRHIVLIAAEVSHVAQLPRGNHRPYMTKPSTGITLGRLENGRWCERTRAWRTNRTSRMLGTFSGANTGVYRRVRPRVQAPTPLYSLPSAVGYVLQEAELSHADLR